MACVAFVKKRWSPILFLLTCLVWQLDQSWAFAPIGTMASTKTTTTAVSATTDATQSRDTVRAVSPYTPEQQWQALESLLEDSANVDFDARHIYGHKVDNHKISMLQLITATRLLDARQEQQDESSQTLQELEQAALAFRQEHGPVLNLQAVIQQQAAAGRMALAAEFKRASPSKGVLASDLSITAGEQATVYAKAGADIISVLTEPRWFLGSWDDLRQARLATAEGGRQRPAILAKEFIVNEYLLAQAAAAGADTCLLIVAVLPQHVLARLIDYARNTLEMEPLVEVHAEAELDVALQAGARVIGVNNRNLHTFQMDLQTSENVAAELTRRGLTFAEASDDYTLCALSGMSSAADVHRYRQAGLQMCLIGESLMRSPHPDQAIASLCLHRDDYSNNQQQASSSSSGAYTAGCQIVKVCGMTNPDDALAACQAGANLIGVIFAEKSKRKVTDEQAKAVVQAVRQFGERQAAHSFVRPTDTETSSSALAQLIAKSQGLVEAAPTRRPLVVGVFQNQDADFIAQRVQECGLDLVQLHGQEGFAAAHPDQCGGVPALRVVDIVVDPTTGKVSDTAVEQLLGSLTGDPLAILLDTAIKGSASGGGTGQTFDWNVAAAVQNAGLPVLVAGGLTPDNVAECVGSTRPFGVDVSSGVEARPGVKNHEAVRTFCQSARRALLQANQGF